jgi:hypothetical protein
VAEAATKLPVKTADKEKESTAAYSGWTRMENLRRDFNRLLEDFGDLWRSPIRHALHQSHFGPAN